MSVDVTTSGIPRQNIPFSKKDESWRKRSVDAYIKMSRFDNQPPGEQKISIQALYDYYHGVLHSEDYKVVLNPYGTKERKNVPADLKRYNIIKPIVDVLVGEKARRPDNAMVMAINSDAVTIKEEQKKAFLVEELVNYYYNTIARHLGEEELSEEDQVSIEEKVEFFERNYTDIRAELGQDALEYIKQYCKMYHKNQKSWKDLLIAGGCVCFNGVNHNEPEHIVLNPVDVDHDKDPELDLIEDGEWAVVRRLMHPSSIIDLYYDELTEEQINKIDDYQDPNSITIPFNLDENEQEERNAERLWEVYQVYWKSKKKVGFVDYIDQQTGEMETIMVSEDYKPTEDESVDWVWINEVWEGHRIGTQTDSIYLNINPLVNQRRSMDNPSKCKLPINGVTYSNRNSRATSLVRMGIPFQLIYDIYKYRLELSIAKSKDVVAEIDVSSIPAEWDIDKYLYFMESTGISFVDYSQEGLRLNPQAKKAMDLSVRTIESYISLLESIRQEWEVTAGIPRQRQGNVDQYSGKGVTESSILQSSYITEEYFTRHALYEEANYQALIDYSKDAWKNGKKGVYVMADGTSKFFDLDADMYQEAEYGVFVTSSRKEVEKLEQLKSLSQAFAQNGGDFQLIASLLESDSFAEIKRKMKEADEAREELEKEARKMEQEALQQQIQLEQMKLENDERDSIRRAEAQLEAAAIAADVKMDVEQLKVDAEQDSDNADNALKKSELEEQKRANRVQEALSRIDLKIKAKQAAKPASKN